MKKCISIYLALILTLTVIVVPSTAETTIKIGELTYLNSEGTSRSGMLAEALNAIQSYSGGFQIFGNTYVLNDEGDHRKTISASKLRLLRRDAVITEDSARASTGIMRASFHH